MALSAWQTRAVAVAALVAGGGLAWWAIGRAPPARADAAPGLASALLARLELPEPAVSERDAHRIQGAAPESDATELCGLGRFNRQDIEEGGAGHAALETLGADALRRTVERLQAQPDERSRAVALMLTGFAERTMDAEGRIDTCEDLARLAVGTRDPWVYGLAHQFCSRRSEAADEGSCQLISVARWAQLEPDNAVPWLFVAAEARTRKDAAGVAEALHRAAQARVNDIHFARSAFIAQAQVPDDVASVLALGIDVNLVGVEAAFVLPGYQVVAEHCVKEALSDPNRRAVCNDLATMLVERSSTMLDLGIGLGMAKRLDWPAERLAEPEELRDAIYSVAAANAFADAAHPSPMGCEAVAAQRERLREVASRGELAAYRSTIAASPLGSAGLAAQYRPSRPPKPGAATAN